MNFFKKLFGGNVEKTPREDKIVEKDLEFKSFFGVDLKHSPTNTWSFDGEETGATGNRIRNYSTVLRNSYFRDCKAKVINNKATNFFFKMPYDTGSIVSIIFTIERDYSPNGVKTQMEAIKKYRGKYEEDKIYDSIQWELEDVNINLSRDIDNGDIELGVWTSFYNSDLDKNIHTAENIYTNDNVNDDAEDSKISIYVPEIDGVYKKLESTPSDTSLNGICKSLGYSTSLFYSWFTDNNLMICFKVFSEDIICVVSNKNLGEKLVSTDVKEIMKKEGFDYEREFSVYNREDLLKEGIEGEFLTQEFMEDVTHKKVNDNKLVDTKNDYTYYFKDGLLIDFNSNDGLVGFAKEMKGSPVFNLVENNAKMIFTDKEQVIKEINIQFKAFSNIPTNQLDIAKGSSYNYNFARYFIENCRPKISYDEFMEYTNGQAELQDRSSSKKIFKYYDRVYNFEDDVTNETNQIKGTRKAHLVTKNGEETELDVIIKRNEEISSVCVEVVSEMSSLQVAKNCLLSKTQSAEEIYFVLTSQNDSIIARNPYTHEYYFTAYSNSLKSLLDSGTNCLGFVSDVDANDATQLIF